MNQIRYGANPTIAHVRQPEFTFSAADELAAIIGPEIRRELELAIKELPDEKIKISWEIENGK